MILMDISGAEAVIRRQGILTCGMVGARVVFRFDKDWEGLTGTAVFRVGAVTRDCVIEAGAARIPHEVLAVPGVPLEIGVYGTDRDGALVIPTVWARTSPIRPGADPSGDTGTEPTLPIWAQLREQGEAQRQSLEALADRVGELPGRLVTLALPAGRWEGSGSLFSQVVEAEGVTGSSQVNLTPTISQLAEFYEKDMCLVTENDGGTVTVYVIGQRPEKDHTIQACIVEVRQ